MSALTFLNIAPEPDSGSDAAVDGTGKCKIQIDWAALVSVRYFNSDSGERHVELVVRSPVLEPTPPPVR